MIRNRLFKMAFLIVILIVGLSLVCSSLGEENQSSYSFEYYKAQLSEEEQDIYESILAMTREQPVLILPAQGMNQEEFSSYISRIYSAVVSDHPLFRTKFDRYVSIPTATEDNQYIVTLPLEEYYSAYTAAKNEFRINDIVRRINSNADRYTKIRQLVRILWQETIYDHFGDMDRIAMIAAYADSATGILTYNTAVCAGYADAVKVLCDAIEVPCIVVGNAAHAWNFIQMENGNWYSLDLVGSGSGEEYEGGQILLGAEDSNYLNESNYHVSDLYIGHPGDFIFPTLNDHQYQYQGEYQYTYTEGNPYPEPEGCFLYTDNPDGSCTITRYEGAASGDLDIPDSIDGKTVTKIGEGAFLRCNGFTGNIIIPDSVKEIGDGAFQDLHNMTGHIVFSNSLEKIGKLAFSGCSKITGSLSFPNTLKEIGTNAFYKCESITGDIRLPESIETVGDLAFYWCPSLNGTFYLPDHLTFNTSMISETGISAIHVSENNLNYVVYDECLYTRDMKTLLYVPAGKTGSLNIPEGVEVIAEEACANLSQKRKLSGTLQLPSTIKRIERRAFLFHTFSGSLRLPDGLIEIGEDAFQSYFDAYEENGFTGDLTIPNSVQKIGSHVFCGNQFGGNLILSSSLTEIPDSAFLYCCFTGDLVIPDSVLSIGKDALSRGGNGLNFINGRLTIGNRVSTIGDYAFYDFGGVSISFPSTLTSIGNHAFSNCENVEILNIPESVTSIGRGAFRCSRSESEWVLKDLYIYNDQVTIKDEAGRTLGLPGVTVIHGNPGSTAEAYATAHGYSFAPIDAQPVFDCYIDGPSIICLDNGAELTETYVVKNTLDDSNYRGEITWASSDESVLSFNQNNGEATVHKAGSIMITVYNMFGNTAQLEVTVYHNHSLTETTATPATCTESGNSACWTCDRCGKHFYDAEGKTEMTLNSWIIPATGHIFNENHQCINCNYVCTHNFDENGYCNTCSYLCSHAGIEEQPVQTEEVIAYVTLNNAQHHIVTRTRQFRECAICHSHQYTGEYADSEPTGMEDHEFDSNGRCGKCHYDCEHPGLEDVELKTRRTEPHFIEIDNTQHVLATVVESYKICPNCHAEVLIGEPVIERQNEPSAHVFDNGYGYCSECGYRCQHEFTDGQCSNCGFVCRHDYDAYGLCSICDYLCPHSDIETIIDEVTVQYEWTSNEKHASVTIQKTHSYCPDCQYKSTQTMKAERIEENHQDTDDDGICDLCQVSIQEGQEKAWNPGDWNYTSGQGHVLTITGSGRMPDYTSVEETPWSAYLNDIDQIVIGEEISSIGANTFANLPKTVRVNFLEAYKPTINEYAFTGTNLICRHYFRNESWPEDGVYGNQKWIYLPFYRDDLDELTMLVYYRTGWTVRDYGYGDIQLENIEQALEISWRGRNYDLEVLPPEDNWEKILQHLGSTMSISFYRGCKGDLSFSYNHDLAPYFDLNVASPELNLTVTDTSTSGEGMAQFVMEAGNVCYNGNIQSIMLRSAFADGTGSNMVVNGQVDQLNFYTVPKNRTYHGSLTVNGVIVEGFVYGNASMSIPNIETPVVYDNIVIAKLENVEQSTPVILNGELNVDGVAAVTDLSIDQYDLTYDLVSDGWYLQLNPKAESGAGSGYGVARIRLSEYKQDFSADDIYWSESTSIHIWNPGDQGKTVLNGGEKDGKAIVVPTILVEGGEVEINCPVDMLWLMRRYVNDEPCIVTVNGYVDYASLMLYRSSGNMIQLGAEGCITRGAWERNINDIRYFSMVPEETNLLAGGQLKVMSWKYGEDIKAILPSDNEIREATGLDDSTEVLVDVGDSSRDEMSEEGNGALSDYLVENHLPETAVLSVFDATVTAYTMNNYGQITSQQEISELNTPVEIIVNNPAEAGETCYIVRIHEDDENNISVEQVSEETTEPSIPFSSDLFSKYAILTIPESTICPHPKEEIPATEATCTEAGNSAYWKCETCGKYFSDANGETEIAENSWIIEALGHVWSEPTYVWGSNNSTVTATRTCQNGDHPETEEKQTERVLIEAPTETLAGSFRWINKPFENDAFAVQEKEGTIPALNTMNVMRLPASLTTIETEAFDHVAADAIILPDTVTTIEPIAFVNCENLKYIKIATGVIIPVNAFDGCPNVVIDQR